jgi:hypothetical protein
VGRGEREREKRARARCLPVLEEEFILEVSVENFF